eukprot:6199424-Pleurochrysis_carterae.AAC.1
MASVDPTGNEQKKCTELGGHAASTIKKTGITTLHQLRAGNRVGSPERHPQDVARSRPRACFEQNSAAASPLCPSKTAMAVRPPCD